MHPHTGLHAASSPETLKRITLSPDSGVSLLSYPNLKNFSMHSLPATGREEATEIPDTLPGGHCTRLTLALTYPAAELQPEHSQCVGSRELLQTAAGLFTYSLI